MRRFFSVLILLVMTVFTAYLTEFVPAGFPVSKGTEVYAVLGDKRIQLSDEDAEDIIYILRNEYWRGRGGKCPFEFNIGFEIGNNRYAVAMDGCDTVDMYSIGGEYICGGGTPFPDSKSAKLYYYKYFDDDDISEYFKHIKGSKLNEV